jgi:hypothetical protein
MLECKLLDSKRQTAFGPLCLLGHYLSQQGALEPLCGVRIVQKSIKHSPTQKLLEALMGILSGCKALCLRASKRAEGSTKGYFSGERNGQATAQGNRSPIQRGPLREALCGQHHLLRGPQGEHKGDRAHPEPGRRSPKAQAHQGSPRRGFWHRCQPQLADVARLRVHRQRLRGKAGQKACLY